jgi:hypothetical protein
LALLVFGEGVGMRVRRERWSVYASYFVVNDCPEKIKVIRGMAGRTNERTSEGSPYLEYTSALAWV